MSHETYANSLGLVKRDDAARRLGISVKTMRKYIRQGRLIAVRYSKTSPLRFREADLRTFIENHRQIGLGQKGGVR